MAPFIEQMMEQKLATAREQGFSFTAEDELERRQALEEAIVEEWYQRNLEMDRGPWPDHEGNLRCLKVVFPVYAPPEAQEASKKP